MGIKILKTLFFNSSTQSHCLLVMAAIFWKIEFCFLTIFSGSIWILFSAPSSPPLSSHKRKKSLLHTIPTENFPSYSHKDRMSKLRVLFWLSYKKKNGGEGVEKEDLLREVDTELPSYVLSLPLLRMHAIPIIMEA